MGKPGLHCPWHNWAIDEQPAFRRNAYRGVDWDSLQRDERPSFGNPLREAETGEEGKQCRSEKSSKNRSKNVGALQICSSSMRMKILRSMS